jgi:hypothetical protein
MIFWFNNAEVGKGYEESTYYRCPGIEEFIEKVQEKKKIVGLEIEGNNIGFILDNKKQGE